MPLLDRIIAELSPRWAMRRAQHRAALRLVHARYDAARPSRRWRGWMADATGPNAETEAALATLRARARDLVRNNAWIAGGLDIAVGYQVGYGIQPRSATGDPGMDERVNAAFAAWARRCDFGGRTDLFGLQAQAARGRAQDGEALALKVALSPAEMRRRGLSVPLAIQLVEPDLLDETLTRTTREGTQIDQGIERDARGLRIAYHLLEEHPGERRGGLTGRTRAIPADAVLHVFRQDRPGQLRGVSDLAPVILRARDLDELEEAALHQAKIQACLAAFVTSPAAAGLGPLERKAEDGDDPVREFSPGMIERLLPGEDVKLNAPAGPGGFTELARHQLHAIAAAWGLTYDLLTGDLSQANYSSLRAGRLAFKRRLEQLQWLLLVPQFCQPLWDAWVEAAQRAFVLEPRPGGYPVEWQVPAFEMVDPLKDAMAERLMIRLGLRTWGQAVQAQGYDPRRQAAEIAEWNAAHDAAGLILDGDARRTGGTGAAQDAAQNAAVEIGATGAAT